MAWFFRLVVLSAPIPGAAPAAAVARRPGCPPRALLFPQPPIGGCQPACERPKRVVD